MKSTVSALEQESNLFTSRFLSSKMVWYVHHSLFQVKGIVIFLLQ